MRRSAVRSHQAKKPAITSEVAPARQILVGAQQAKADAAVPDHLQVKDRAEFDETAIVAKLKAPGRAEPPWPEHEPLGQLVEHENDRGDDQAKAKHGRALWRQRRRQPSFIPQRFRA
jgi:hypothetical protein